jgi:hypothetical protein
MEALLPLDVTSTAWRAVKDYADARISILTAECVDMATTADRRSELAARIAELRELLCAPSATLRATEMRETTPRGTY